MYIEQELIEKYNSKKTRGMQKALLKELADKKLPVQQPTLSLIMIGKFPVNKHRYAVIKDFINNE
jgi:hypothetical protein